MILVDTNVLVYFYDPREPVKQSQAHRVVAWLQSNGQGCLSAQVLAEFCRVALRKLVMTPSQIAQQVELIAQTWPIFDLTPLIVVEAIRGVRDHQLAYYDAQIWATARLNQIPVLFSEDFRDGVTLEGVRFANPFSTAFALEDWT